MFIYKGRIGCLRSSPMNGQSFSLYEDRHLKKLVSLGSCGGGFTCLVLPLVSNSEMSATFRGLLSTCLVGYRAGLRGHIPPLSSLPTVVAWVVVAPAGSVCCWAAGTLYMQRSSGTTPANWACGSCRNHLPDLASSSGVNVISPPSVKVRGTRVVERLVRSAQAKNSALGYQ